MENSPPTGRYETNKHNTAQLDPEALERILSTPVPCSEFSDLDSTTPKETIKRNYNTQVAHALYQGEELDVDNTVNATLRDRFLTINQRFNNDLGSTIDNTVFTDRDFIAGSAASLIAANMPNPGDFLEDMLARIPASEQSEDLNDKLANIAQAVYGSRYEAYVDEVDDDDADESGDNVDAEFSTNINESTLEHNKQEDAEILRRSHTLKRFVYDTARKTMNNWNMLTTNTRNAAASPQLWARENAYKRAKKRYEKKAAKVKPESNSRLNQHRQAVADRHEAIATEKMQKRDIHKDSMKNRLYDAQEKTEGRNFIYQERVNQYKERKEAAVARKELRETLKADKANYFEREAIIKQIPAEQLQRIGRVACSYNAALSVENKVGSQVKQAGSYLTTLETSYATTTEHKETLLTLSDTYEAQANKINEKEIPKIRELIEIQQQEIASLSEDDEQYQEVSGIIAILQDRERQREQEAVTLREQAKDSREKAKLAQDKQQNLEKRIAAQKDKLTHSRQRLGGQQSVADVRYTSKRSAINDIINSNENR